MGYTLAYLKGKKNLFSSENQNIQKKTRCDFFRFTIRSHHLRSYQTLSNFSPWRSHLSPNSMPSPSVKILIDKACFDFLYVSNSCIILHYFYIYIYRRVTIFYIIYSSYFFLFFNQTSSLLNVFTKTNFFLFYHISQIHIYLQILLIKQKNISNSLNRCLTKSREIIH